MDFCTLKITLSGKTDFIKELRVELLICAKGNYFRVYFDFVCQERQPEFRRAAGLRRKKNF